MISELYTGSYETHVVLSFVGTVAASEIIYHVRRGQAPIRAVLYGAAAVLGIGIAKEVNDYYNIVVSGISDPVDIVADSFGVINGVVVSGTSTGLRKRYKKSF